MSDTVKPEEVTTECSVCGKPGIPDPACTICHGNRAFIQSRAYTRSEEIRKDRGDAERYSRTGNVSPKIVNRPGSFTPDQS
jgi:hypothetical protein